MQASSLKVTNSMKEVKSVGKVLQDHSSRLERVAWAPSGIHALFGRILDDFLQQFLICGFGIYLQKDVLLG